MTKAWGKGVLDYSFSSREGNSNLLLVMVGGRDPNEMGRECLTEI